MKPKPLLFILLLALLLSLCQGGDVLILTPAQAEEQVHSTRDTELDIQWVDEQNGTSLPLDARFQDSSGTMLRLGDIIDRPTLILPVYFHCPTSCSLNLSHLATAVKRSNFTLGQDFKIIAFSFNAQDTPAKAKAAKENYMPLLPEELPKEDWLFLTGKEEHIRALTAAMGYRFAQQKDGTFIHPSALVAASAEGMIIKYVYGSFISGDVDMALAEAIKGKPATSVRRFLDYCFNYVPEKTRAVFNNIKLLVLVGFALAGVLLFFFLIREKKATKDTAQGDQHE